MLKPSLQLKLGQTLTMTPQLQQAIRLLQLPALELQAHIREMLESNVMLEPVEENDTTGIFEAPETPQTAAPAEAVPERQTENTVEVVDEGWGEQSVGTSEAPWNSDDDDRQQEFADDTGQSLQDHLVWQLEMARLAPRELGIARAIADAVSEDGYLTESLEEITRTLQPEIVADLPEVEKILAFVQSLDPPGVAARSVGECIELQLKQLDPDTPGLELAVQIARHHLGLVADRELSLLRRELRSTDEDLAAALALVRACHPRPGATVSSGNAEYVVPDVFVRRTDHGWAVEINAATLPRVRLNQGYASLIGRNASHASMRAQLQEARWLLKSLEIRNETLMKVARSIVERQTASRARRRVLAADDPGTSPKPSRCTSPPSRASPPANTCTHRAASSSCATSSRARWKAPMDPAPPPRPSAPRSKSSSRKKMATRPCRTGASQSCSLERAFP
jgi:RNA polymerase sigma-54 factor